MLPLSLLLHENQNYILIRKAVVNIEENSNNNGAIKEQFQQDTKNVSDFLDKKSPSFDVYSLKRLVLSELSYKGAFRHNRICGFTRNQIQNMSQYPERYGKNIVRLSRYMYLKSGYYKRLIDYFANMGIINWTVDLEAKTAKAYSPDDKLSKQIRTNYYKYVAQVNKFKLDNHITDIMRRLFVEDACFAYIVENDIETSLYFLNPMYCEIKKNIGGNVFGFAINRSLIDNDLYETLPSELQELITQSKEISLNNMVMIPYENSLCIKYHNDFTYLYSPFLGLITEILNIDDAKDLAKAKSESDAYKLIYLKIPTNEEDQIAMGDEIITPFTNMVKQVVPETYGVVPVPMDLELVESKSTVADNVNRVEQNVENYYSEAGVSKALISSASSGSELKLSMKVDSSDIYRIYKQLEAWIDLQMKLRGHIYPDYQFAYNIIPTTIFDVNDNIDLQLKLAQASVVNKTKLAASSGINPAKMLGNTILETSILGDIFNSWQPLKSSYTQSESDSDEGGRPTMDETEISKTTDTQRGNDSNKTENRI